MPTSTTRSGLRRRQSCWMPCRGTPARRRFGASSTLGVEPGSRLEHGPRKRTRSSGSSPIRRCVRPRRSGLRGERALRRSLCRPDRSGIRERGPRHLLAVVSLDGARAGPRRSSTDPPSRRRLRRVRLRRLRVDRSAGRRSVRGISPAASEIPRRAQGRGWLDADAEVRPPRRHPRERPLRLHARVRRPRRARSGRRGDRRLRAQPRPRAGTARAGSLRRRPRPHRARRNRSPGDRQSAGADRPGLSRPPRRLVSRRSGTSSATPGRSPGR